MSKLIYFLRRTRFSKSLTFFLVGVVSVITVYTSTLLPAQSFNKQPQAISDNVTFEQADPPVNSFDDHNLDQPVSTLALSSTKINWTTVAPSPVARSETARAIVNGRLYVFGGFVKSTVNPVPRPISRSDVYNPANNSWTRIADLPNPLTHTATAVDGRNIYLAGGYPGKPGGGQRYATTAVWRYNVDTNTWLAMPSLLQARGGGALERLGRQLHFFGGSDINRADKNNHWVLSLDNGTKWVPATGLPNPVNHLGSATVRGKIYAIGGQRGQDRNSVTQSTVYRWEPSRQNWTQVARLPSPRSHIAAATFVSDGRIIVAGGEIVHGKSVSTVTAYNPLSNSWKALTPLPAPRHSGAAGSIGNQIFYTTGNDKGILRTTTYKGVPV